MDKLTTIKHASDQETVSIQDTVIQGVVPPVKIFQSTVAEDSNPNENLTHSYEEVEEKGSPVTICNKEHMIPPEEPKITVVKSPSIRNILKMKMVPCGECNRVLSYQESFNNHMGTHTEKILQACYICENIFKMKSNMSQHAKKAHKSKSPGIRNVVKKEMFLREECSKVLRCQKNLTNHMTIHTGNHLQACHTCGRIFHMRSNMIVNVVTAQLKTGATR